MKIYFCDKCNESIPLNDIKSNRITIDAGKIYCQKCAPRPPKTQTTLNLPTLAAGALLCVAIGAVAMALWGDALLGRDPSESLEDRVGRVERGAAQRFARLDEGLAELRSELEEAPGADGRPGKLARIAAGMRANDEAIQQIRRELSALSAELEARQDRFESAHGEAHDRLAKDIEDLRALADQIATDVGRVHGTLDDLTAAQESFRARLRALESATVPVSAERPAAVERRTGDDAGVATEPAEPEDPARTKALERALAMLKEKEAPKRFQAVFELAELKGKRAEEALVEAVDDDTDYVQTAALTTLADLDAKWTIPHIIEKLKDDNDFVREAAITSLERLLGRSIGLAPDAKPDKRLSKIRELKKWWAENKDRFLTS